MQKYSGAVSISTLQNGPICFGWLQFRNIIGRLSTRACALGFKKHIHISTDDVIHTFTTLLHQGNVCSHVCPTCEHQRVCVCVLNTLLNMRFLEKPAKNCQPSPPPPPPPSPSSLHLLLLHLLLHLLPSLCTSHV